jgi:D-alanyl-lipoteichoic acid acyltransferase DltB (MBOAT superfamily)
MLFDTFLYWGFFASVLVLLACLRDRPGKMALVLVSYIFYAAWDWRFCFLLALSSTANYLFGRWIDGNDGKARQRAVTLAIVFNLGLLGFFKYCNFFVASFAALFHLPAEHLLLQIVLPVGISFFTFEGIAYAVDVYRRQMPAVQNKTDFALFVAFFPHLVAGPIIRPMDFFPQLATRHALGSVDTRWGLREILKGLIKKIVFANYCAPIADAFFTGHALANAAVPAWIGVLAFSLQIYFDFSGYTDIARGCARLLGYQFPSNFERPYLSANITEFWRRWHISLSSWLRDYLYISIGGNRISVPRTYLNLLIVMFLGGLWHGASWNFAAWGLYHGALLCLHRLWQQRPGQKQRASTHRWYWPLSALATFLLVSLGWIPFRADGFGKTLAILASLPNLTHSQEFLAQHWGIWLIPLLSLFWCGMDRDRSIQNWLAERASLASAVAAAVIAIYILQMFAQLDVQIPFVYFQF